MTSAYRSRPLAVTAGEPAGIGPELCLALAKNDFARKLVLLADPDVLHKRAQRLGVECEIVEFDPTRPDEALPMRDSLLVWSHAVPDTSVCGTPNPANAQALLDALRAAVEGCLNGTFSGLVTAPLQKSTINDAGISFTGHTEYLAELTQTPTPVMLLVAGELRVALASTHMPLAAVPDYITRDRLTDVIRVLHRDLSSRFAISDPEIVVCGLNPHAGEGGHLGSEDAQIIKPVIDQFQTEKWNIRGPMPADTAFTAAGGHADAVLAMYHDQGLPVLKYAGFGTAVNVTLGLPIVRTSVDHGTALDIAGTGRADPGSLFAAVELAASLASR